MGICISNTRTSLPPKTVKKHHKSKSKNTRKQSDGNTDARRKSPPPTLPLSDEETVKEVLSEIPKQPSPLPKVNETPFIKAAPLLQDFSKLPNEKHPKGNELPAVAAEICNTHGGGVGGLAKIKEKREYRCNGNNDVREVYQRSPAWLKNRSSGEVKRDKTLGKSPGRASEPSLDRSRPGSISSSGNGRRKEAGGISGRRSRSPVSRASCGSSKYDFGRSPSSRRLGKSPGRVGSGLGDRLRKLDEGKENGRDKWPRTSNEFLENPVVSLECFIFL